MKFLTLFIAFISCVHSMDIIVNPSESIQDAVDMAEPGDTIKVQPGVYQNSNNSSLYGVHITKSNIKLIGDVTGDEQVIIQKLPLSSQVVGILAAPPDCDFDTPDGEDGCDASNCTTGITIQGITVTGFSENGIQTRCVDDFIISQCTVYENIGIGIYPTLSYNGIVTDNESHKSKSGAIWSNGSENITILNNILYDSTYGIIIAVSNKVLARNNTIYNNTVGIALLHPNGTNLPVRPVMKDWIIEENDIRDNNKFNDALFGLGQDIVPPGLGVFILGVSNHQVRNNYIADNGFAGIGMSGYCTGESIGDPLFVDCTMAKADPSANNNTISKNTFRNNGNDLPQLIADAGIPGVDLLYLQSPTLYNEIGDGNCFEIKIKTSIFALVDFAPAGRFGQQLPNGCEKKSPFIKLFNQILTVPKLLFNTIFG